MFLVVKATGCVLETQRECAEYRQPNQATGVKTTGWEESVGGASEHFTILGKKSFCRFISSGIMRSVSVRGLNRGSGENPQPFSHPAKIQHSQEHLSLKVIVCVDLVSALTRLRPPLRYSRHVDRRWCGEVQPLHPGQVLLKHRQAFLQTLLVKRDENLVVKLQLLFRLHHIQTSSGTHHVVHGFFWLVHRKVHAGFEEASGESFLKLGDTKVTNI